MVFGKCVRNASEIKGLDFVVERFCVKCYCSARQRRAVPKWIVVTEEHYLGFFLDRSKLRTHRCHSSNLSLEQAAQISEHYEMR